MLSFLAVPTASGAPVSSSNSALRRYPYLTDVTSTYATLNWATNRSKAGGGVRYGRVGSESCTANYVAATKTAISVNGVAQYQWKAQLDLQAGTPYCYRVYLGTASTGEIDLLGTDASLSFQTQVSGGSTSSFSFVVLGDWGQVNSSGKNPSQAKLMSLIASSGALFVVTTGDNGYPSGNQTNYGDLVQTGSNISAIFGPSFWKIPGSSIPIFPVLGNHGLSSSDTNHPALVTWPQTRTVSTSGGRSKKETYCCLDGTTSKSYPSLWYAFDAGPARFYMLQAAWSEANIGNASNAYEVDYDYHWAPTTAQYKWLKADLTAHPSGLKFVFLHYPIHSDSSTQPSDTFLQGSNGIEGLFKQHGVDIVFTGHAHIYQRNRAGTAGVINYVTGGGGATLGSLGTCTSLDAYAIGFTTKGKACGSAPVPTSADQVYHFLKVTVNGSSVTVTPINALGKSFDVMNYNLTSAQALAPAEIAPETVVPSTSTATPSQTLAPTSSPTATATVTCTPTSTPPPLATERATTPQKPTSKRSPTVTPVPTHSPAVTTTPTCTPTLAGQPATETPTATPSPAALSPAAPLPPIVGPGGALTFISEADAQVAESAPATNFGTSTELQANGGSGNTQISFIRFNVSDSHDTIQSVKLRLFSTMETTNAPAVYLAANNWVEAGKGSVTWSNQPELLSGEVDNKGAMGAGTWVEYDVSSMVDGDGTYTFALLADGTDNAIFSSREGSASPQLVMTFSP